VDAGSSAQHSMPSAGTQHMLHTQCHPAHGSDCCLSCNPCAAHVVVTPSLTVWVGEQVIGLSDCLWSHNTTQHNTTQHNTTQRSSSSSRGIEDSVLLFCSLAANTTPCTARDGTACNCCQGSGCWASNNLQSLPPSTPHPLTRTLNLCAAAAASAELELRCLCTQTDHATPQFHCV
jgi:hypothetical protein